MDNPIHCHVREVAFSDADPSGWMHYPNVFRYVETAEHEFLRRRGLVVFDPAQGGWPRVSANCDYRRPLRPGDKIEVQLSISRIGNSSVAWTFEVLSENGELMACGGITTVRVDSQGTKQLLSEEERSALQSR